MKSTLLCAEVKKNYFLFLGEKRQIVYICFHPP